MSPKYRNKQTEQFARGEFVRAFAAIAQQAERRLRSLEAATSLQDIGAIPGYRLERLRGDREGQFSIRINDQYRICFEWPDNETGAVNVEIVDYH